MKIEVSQTTERFVSFRDYVKPGDVPTTLMVTDWSNGEGMYVSFSVGREERLISLTITEAEALVMLLSSRHVCEADEA